MRVLLSLERLEDGFEATPFSRGPLVRVRLGRPVENQRLAGTGPPRL